METLQTTQSLPEPGQLVTVRQRHFVVLDVQKSTLPGDSIQSSLNAPQHVVSLSSVEDDALGEELRVVWELEPGAHAYEKVALPASCRPHTAPGAVSLIPEPLDLGHGFHETKQGIRDTISESARRIVLDRLLAHNHQSATPKKSPPAYTTKNGKREAGKKASDAVQGDLISPLQQGLF